MNRRIRQQERSDAFGWRSRGNFRACLRSTSRRVRRNVSRFLLRHPCAGTILAAFTIGIAVFSARLVFRGRNVSGDEEDNRVWVAGASKIDITPRDRVWLSGFASRNRTADATTPLNPSIPLYARALSLRPRIKVDGGQMSGKSLLLIIALDIIGIDRAFSDRVHSAAHASHGLSRSQLHLIPSHTHSGPVVNDNLAPLVPEEPAEWAKIAGYSDFLFGRIIKVIDMALSEDVVIPTRVQFAQGVANLAVNRRQVSEVDFDGSRRGLTDDFVPTMWMTDAKGAVVAGAYGYAAHATILTNSYRYSGDYPGFASASLERAFPGSTWLYLPGCGGDQNIYPRGNEKLAIRHGTKLAQIVSGVITANRKKDAVIHTPTLKLDTRQVTLQFERTLSRADLRRLQRSSRIAERRAANMMLPRVAAGGRTQESYEYPIAVAFIGNLKMIFLGGEPIVDYCYKLRENGAEWIVGYTDDVMGYLATKKARREGGREGSERAALYYGLPAAWEEDVETKISEAARALLNS